MKKTSLFVAVLAISIIPITVFALGLGVFGGKVILTVQCDEGGKVVTVGPPRPGIFLYQPGISTVYQRNNIEIDHWVLGTFFPGGACTVDTLPIPVEGIMDNVGTS